MVLREFWNVKPGRLVDEIDQIKDKTDPLTWQAIDAVRKVGNIGAHMEKDINIIIDVDPNEAQLLCGFDYKMSREESPFLAVEVKGLTTSTGAIQLTSKEHKVAQFLEDRFFLFVVRNFAEKPFHTVFQNPLNSSLVFDRRESVAVQVSWSTCIGR